MNDDDATRSQAPAVAPTANLTTTTIEPGATFVDEPESYSVGGQIGAGGMGTVLAALGSRLGRPVALKVVTADREDLRRRFEREAHVTARLQHPAIVPVYGSGRRDGMPFYAMKHVTGEPLDKVIAKTTSLSERIALLPKVIAVTEAIAYAHAEKVIHRDLKPANILVGAFGETVVIDWGLAKDMTASDDEPAASPYRASDADTAHGKVMGTPAYMPIEQAQGEAVDERADVYALGAILHHTLSGRAPYKRADEDSIPWESMLARVIAAPPPPLGDDVPSDLRTIVARAMARDPAQRYPSAGDLAEDLRRFQTGQLVGAHRYSTWQLVKRWLRRNKTPVAVAVAATVVLAVGGVVSVVRILAEQKSTEVQREAAVESRGQAEDLMGFMLVDLRKKLRPLGKIDLLGDVANKARAYYDSRAEQLTPGEVHKRVLALRNLGEVLAEQGHTADALVEYEAAIAIDEGLLALDPDDSEARRGLAAGHHELGDMRWAQGDGPGALAAYRRELAIAEPLGTKTALEARPSITGHLDIGYILAEQGDLKGALAEDQAALAIVEPLSATAPTTDVLRDLSIAKSRIADVHREAGDGAAALGEFRAALASDEKLVAAHPDDADLQRELAVGHNKVGDVLAEANDFATALAEYRQAQSIFVALAAKDLTSADRLRDLAASHAKLGETLAAQRDIDGALAELRTAHAMFEQIAAGDPTNAERQGDLALVHERIGTLLKARGDLAGALVEFRAELDIASALVAKDPTKTSRQRTLSVVHVKLGNILLARPDPVGALVEYRAAATIADAIQAKHPTPFDERGRAIAHFKIARALAANHDGAGAIAEYEPFLALAQAKLRAEPASDPSDLGEVLEDVGDAEVLRGNLAAACERFAAAREIAVRLSKQPHGEDAAKTAAELATKLTRCHIE